MIAHLVSPIFEFEKSLEDRDMSKDERILKYTRYLEFAKSRAGSSSLDSPKKHQMIACSARSVDASASWKSTRSRWADCEDEDSDSESASKGASSGGEMSRSLETVKIEACASDEVSDVHEHEDFQRFCSTSTTASESESGERTDKSGALPPYRQIELEDEFHFQQIEIRQQQSLLDQQLRNLRHQQQELENQSKELLLQEREHEMLMRKQHVRLSEHVSYQETQKTRSLPPGNWNFLPTVHPFGCLHRFHPKAALTGLAADFRSFTKLQGKGRLSILSENEVRYNGIHRYMVRFTSGELSNADGVGIIFSNELPCPKNIQRITSVFVNRTGRICIRANADVERCDICVKSLELGDWLEVISNFDDQIITFSVWPRSGGPCSTATINFGYTFDLMRLTSTSIPRKPCGYLAAVVKHPGVTVILGS
jgi:hypothetical protein